MSGNKITPSRESKFQNHIVIGIVQKWPPEIMDILQARERSESAQKAESCLHARARWQVLFPRENSHPFDIERNGKADFKTARGNHFDNGKAGSSA